jgi:hypothetical protein
MGIEINAVVDLAAAFKDEGQSHAVEEPETAAHVGGSFAAGEVSTGRGEQWNFSDGAGRCRISSLWLRKIERQLSREKRRISPQLRRVRAGWHDI